MKNNTLPISGLFIYKNKNNQNVYYDIFTKKAFIVDKSNEKTYQAYSTRPILALLVFALMLFIIKSSPVISTIVAIVAYIALCVAFRVTFLYKLVEDTRFVKYKKNNFIVSISDSTEKYNILITVICTLCISVFAVFNIIKNNYTGFYFVGNLLFAIICAIVSIVYFITFIYKIRK